MINLFGQQSTTTKKQNKSKWRNCCGGTSSTNRCFKLCQSKLSH